MAHHFWDRIARVSWFHVAIIALQLLILIRIGSLVPYLQTMTDFAVASQLHAGPCATAPRKAGDKA